MRGFWRYPLLPATFAWALATICGLSPPFSRDALNDHLMLPLLWRQQGWFWRDSWLTFTAFPPLADIPYILFAGKPWDVAASLWHALGALATLLLLARALRQYDLPAGQRGWGLLLWMAMPTSLALCGWAYVDLWLCAAAAGCVLILSLPELKPSHGWGLGAAAAAAVLIKYNGLVAALAVALALAWRLATAPRLLMAIAWRALIVCLPPLLWWYGDNAAQLGSALYPLGGRPGSLTWLDYRMQAYGESYLWAALAPLRVFLWGEVNNPQLFDGMLSPIWLLAPLALSRADRRASALLVAAMVYLLFAVSVDIRARYMLPATVFLVPLACMALQRITAAKLRRALLIAALIPGVMAYGQYLSWSAPWTYWQHGRAAYLAAHVADYPIQHWAATHLPEDARVYLLWMAGRAYYLRRSYGADIGREGERLRRIIRHGGGFPFTHILMNRRLAERSLGSELGDGWKRWLSGTCLLARQGDFELRRFSVCR